MSKSICYIPAEIKYIHKLCYINQYINVTKRLRNHSTLNVRGPSYLGLTRSISWLLMPWLLTSPGHQQPWYWQYRMCRSFSHLRKDFKYLCEINVEEYDIKCNYMFMFPLKNVARKGLSTGVIHMSLQFDHHNVCKHYADYNLGMYLLPKLSIISDIFSMIICHYQVWLTKFHTSKFTYSMVCVISFACVASRHTLWQS